MKKMETKELFIEVLNRAIRVYKSDKHQPIGGDVVIDYNTERCRIASYIERHPGCIVLPVILQEGTGYFFFKVVTEYVGNVVYLAWEEDNNMRSFASLCRSEVLESRDSCRKVRIVKNMIEEIVGKTLL